MTDIVTRLRDWADELAATWQVGRTPSPIGPLLREAEGEIMRLRAEVSALQGRIKAIYGDWKREPFANHGEEIRTALAEREAEAMRAEVHARRETGT